jgi:hypothetical protein
VNIVEKLSRDRLAIFLFHGVVKDSSYQVRNYTRKHLTRDVFFNHMKALKAEGAALSMDQVVEHVQKKKPFPKGAFAITFDDGFENNYSVARPVLKELKIPAAVYITSGFIEHNAMSWIDRVEYAFEYAKVSSVKLSWKQSVSMIATPAERRAVLDDIRFNVKRDQAIDVEGFVRCGRFREEHV